MSWVIDRFRHHAATGGLRQAVARGASAALGLSAQRLQVLSAKLADPASAGGRLSRPIARQIAANAGFRDRFQGQRALVLATGPSARKLSPQIAEGRALIAVNETFTQAQALGLRMTALVLHDAMYFSEHSGMERMIADASVAAKAEDALIVVPTWAIPKLQAIGDIAPDRIVGFFESGLALADCPTPGRILDLARPTPSLHTVAHTAVATALFLGFREVALLGIDLTYVAHPTIPIPHSYGANAYHDALDRQVAAEAYRANSNWSWSYVLRDVARQLDAYGWLAEGANRDGRRIVNLAADSLLTTVPAIVQEHIA